MGTPQYTVNSSKLLQIQGTEGVKFIIFFIVLLIDTSDPHGRTHRKGLYVKVPLSKLFSRDTVYVSLHYFTILITLQ